jgi:hypothetical protein
MTIDILREMLSRLESGETFGHIVVYHKDPPGEWHIPTSIDEMTKQERTNAMKILAMLSGRAYTLNMDDQS